MYSIQSFDQNAIKVAFDTRNRTFMLCYAFSLEKLSKMITKQQRKVYLFYHKIQKLANTYLQKVTKFHRYGVRCFGVLRH